MPDHQTTSTMRMTASNKPLQYNYLVGQTLIGIPTQVLTRTRPRGHRIGKAPAHTHLHKWHLNGRSPMCTRSWSATMSRLVARYLAWQ